MSDQQPQHTKEELAKLIEKQRKQRELIAEFNAKFSRPGAWTIGKELGGQWLAAGIVKAMAEYGPRKATQ
jgi:benzoyl-CoA reductase/2-hydroxyglutaryl-CoA dehydratase subunit BcrC/BadD/HgdB